MESNGEARTLSYFLAGIGIGTIFGMLFAPRSGQETRRYIRERVDEGRETLRRQTEGLRDRAEEAIEKGKDIVGRGRESVGAAVEVGKQAYREEKEKSSFS
ncbi:MAG: YtxH domain-containing protein [Candidatus Binatia bacterium]